MATLQPLVGSNKIKDEYTKINTNFTALNNETTAHYASKNPHDSIPMCMVRRSTAQSIADSSNTAISFNVEEKDNDNMFDSSGDATRITINTAGKYLFVAFVGFAANATGVRLARLLKNGAFGTDTYMMQILAPGASSSALMTISGVYNMAQGDYMVLEVQQTSGGSLNTVAHIKMTAIRVGS